MITMAELVKGRDKQAPTEFTKEVRANLAVLLEKMNVIRAKYGKPMTVTSGWRTAAGNAQTVGAAKKSKHLSGLACDILDSDGSLWAWVLQNLELMQELGIYLESKKWTKTWVHFQIGPSVSGKRIFRPSAAAATNPDAIDTYDSKFDKA